MSSGDGFYEEKWLNKSFLGVLSSCFRQVQWDTVRVCTLSKVAGIVSGKTRKWTLAVKAHILSKPHNTDFWEVIIGMGLH